MWATSIDTTAAQSESPIAIHFTDIVNSLAIRRGTAPNTTKHLLVVPTVYLNIFSSISSLQVASTVSASMISTTSASIANYRALYRSYPFDGEKRRHGIVPVPPQA